MRSPIHSIKHCVQEMGNLATDTALSQRVIGGPAGTEVTVETFDAAARESGVPAGAKVYRVMTEVFVKPSAAGNPSQGIEWAYVRSAEQLAPGVTTADVITSGLARDLIGKYGGQVLKTGMTAAVSQQPAIIRCNLKIPKGKQTFKTGGALWFFMFSHMVESTDFNAKHIFKAYT